VRQTTSRPPRAGFTLIELLVVLSIIAVLTSLTAAAVQRVRLQRIVKTSEDTVGKVQSALDNQVKVISDKVNRERLEKSPDFSSLVAYCGNDEERAVALLLYCRLRQYLPETAAEVGAASFTVGGVVFRRPPAFDDLAGISGNADAVSAALLYAALSRRSVGGNTFASDDATAGAQMELPLNGNRRVYKDGWDNPIAFRRYHRSAELDAAPYSQPADTTKDPLDPKGVLAGLTGTWANKAAAESALGITFPVPTRNTVPTAYSFGLNKAPNGPGGDDILGYKLRSIGAKGFNP
jgi:prepilin-type N-terminal cleavage/methylation domain-containing protein